MHRITSPEKIRLNAAAAAGFRGANIGEIEGLSSGPGGPVGEVRGHRIAGCYAGHEDHVRGRTAVLVRI